MLYCLLFIYHIVQFLFGINTDGFGDPSKISLAKMLSFSLQNSFVNIIVLYSISLKTRIVVHWCHRDPVEADQHAGHKMSTASLDSVESSKERPLSRRSSLHSLPDLDGRCQLFLSVCLHVFFICVILAMVAHVSCIMWAVHHVTHISCDPQVSHVDEHAWSAQTAARGREEVLEGDDHVCGELPQATTSVEFLR